MANLSFLGELIGKSKFGAKGIDESEAARKAVIRANNLIALFTLNPELASVKGKAAVRAGLDPLTAEESALVRGSNITQLSQSQIASFLPQGITLQTIGQIEANLIGGNTRESKARAANRRRNILAGRSDIDFLEPPPPPPEPLEPVDIEGEFGKLRSVKGGFRKGLTELDFIDIQRANPDLNDKELLDLVEEANRLLGQVEGFARRAQFDEDPLQKARFAQARDDARAILNEIGFEAQVGEAIEIGTGLQTREPVRARADVGTGPTAEEGSAAAVRQAEIQSNRILRQIESGEITPEQGAQQQSELQRIQKKREEEAVGIDPVTGIRFPLESRKERRGGPVTSVKGTVPRGVPEGTKPEVETALQELANTNPEAADSVMDSLGFTSTPEPDNIAENSATTAGMSGAASSSPESAKDGASQSMIQGYEEYDKAIEDQDRIKEIKEEGAKEREEKRDAYIGDWKEKYEKIFDDSKDVLDSVRERKEKHLLEQKKNALAQLAWQQNETLRNEKRKKNEAIIKRERELILGGGGWSGNGLREIREADAEWDQQITNMAIQFGFQRSDKSDFFTEKYIKIQEDYEIASEKATKDLRTELQRLEGQEITSAVTREKAEEDAMTEYESNVSKIRLDKAVAIREDAKTMAVDNNAKRKAEIKEGDDKLKTKSRIRSDIQRDKTITSSNDVDGFFGALLASNERYLQVLDDIKTGKINKKEGESALGISQTGVVAGLARIFDPGSVVRNEEFERQTRGQAWVNVARGFWQRIEAGGIGLSSTDVAEMVIVANQVHESWEERYQVQMQQFIGDVDDWNENHPENVMEYKDVLPIDRLPLEQQTEDKWTQDDTEGNTDTPSSETLSFDNWKSSVGSGNVIEGSKFHTGLDESAVDIDGKIGDPIPAFSSGRVTQVDNKGEGGLGKFVVVTDSQGFKKLYAHLDSVSLKVGNDISSGDNIGMMGNTGNVIPLSGDGSHLHFRVTRDGKPFTIDEYLSITQV